MKKIVFIALLALSTSALANISIGMWHSDDMTIQVSFNGFDFTRYDPAGDAFIQCKITNWPISSPVAESECENGESHKVEIGEGSVVFDGVILRQSVEGLD